MSVEESLVLVGEPVENILQLSLNRPDRLNALTPDLLDRLGELLRDIAGSPDVRAVILTGMGRGFCAGFDLDELERTRQLGLPELMSRQEGWAAVVQSVVDLPVPVIAAVNGPAAGAGMSLALAADLRVMTEGAFLSAAFVKVGLSGADLGLSWSLPRIAGMALAAELMLTGRRIHGPEAHRAGLANRLCDADALLPAAVELAQSIAANSPFGVKVTKRVLHTGIDAPSLSAAMDMENRNQILASGTDDMAEALRAFREDREPEFRNR